MANLISIFLLIVKSFFYQGNYNTENMQGTGFAWLARPILKRRGITLSEEHDKELGAYFNTNPSFVTALLGIFLKECQNGNNGIMAKNAYSSAFAALGDSFFWHALRPLLCFVSIFLVLYVSPWGIAIYPIVYGGFHILFLFFGGLVGSVLGLNTITLFNRFRFKEWANIVDKVSIFIIGALIVKGLEYSSSYEASDNMLLVTVLAFAAFIGGVFVYNKVSRPVFAMGLLILLLATLGAVGGYNIWIQ
ncbi:MAG: PTS system mannose/fructose/sorbose family transporter subunit IID [Deferribacteraceae bacterium]|jgi:PTS system mannose-specific IID component|nr:PTS system mannose/fructose/sorbose family transporter subunit IID [Deferribacteraceae bacterium]